MTILVPMDFSKNAENALHYAARMAQVMHGNLKIVHVLTPIVTKTTYLSIAVKEMHQSAMTELDRLQREMREEYQIECRYSVMVGDISDQIIEASQEKGIYLLVMGSNKKRHFLFGNITTQVVEKSAVPVMVLPKDMEFTHLKKIVFATDYHANDIEDLRQLSEIAAAFDCPINVVHIVNRFEDEEQEYEPGLVEEFTQLIQRNISYPKISCVEYQYIDVPEGIQSYAEEEQSDLLVVSTRQHKFMQRIFSRSITREILFDFNQPILVYHTREMIMD